jgi:ABC-type polysaccharide/polyol phosphate export permease
MRRKPSLPQIAFMTGGFFLPLDTLPPAIAWIVYLNPVFYTFRVLIAAAFKARVCRSLPRNPDPFLAFSLAFC